MWERISLELRMQKYQPCVVDYWHMHIWDRPRNRQICKWVSRKGVILGEMNNQQSSGCTVFKVNTEVCIL